MGENIPSNRNESVVCVGASLVDLTFRCDATPVLNTSNPATMHRSPGGVVRNIAHGLSLLNIPVELITVLGDDPDGHWLSKQYGHWYLHERYCLARQTYGNVCINCNSCRRSSHR
ncbi:MAG: hypothetical protein IPN88_13510 [Bacteroidetes bacterium]|nr:hypothetical protein [Bacteroidota bacterium]